MNTITYYSYADLRAQAIKPDATQQNINDLGEWFERFGSTCWNGEYFDVDDGLRLYRIEEPDPDRDYISNVVGYKFD